MPFYDDTDGFAGGPNFRFGNATDKQGGVVIQFYHVPTAKKALQYEWDNGSQAKKHLVVWMLFKHTKTLKDKSQLNLRYLPIH
jgi:hypothetical protein